MKYLLIAFLCTFSCSLLAQDFQYPMSSFSRNETSYFYQKDGTEILAKLKRIHYKKRLINSVTIETGTGETISLLANDIDHMYLMPSKLNKLSAAMDKVLDLQEHGKDRSVDNEKISAGYVLFESTNAQVKKKNRDILLQLLNPHFSGNIKVYHDPSAKETASLGVGDLTVTGGNAKSYYVKKGDGTAFLMRRNDYRKSGKDLYSDCKTFLQNFSPKWSDFNKHVADYNSTCD
jgi:hypothetical protein